jgi:hypothetical protein
MRTAKITSHQIISGRTEPEYPLSRSSDENRKPRIAVDAATKMGKQDSMIETTGTRLNSYLAA